MWEHSYDIFFCFTRKMASEIKFSDMEELQVENQTYLYEVSLSSHPPLPVACNL